MIEFKGYGIREEKNKLVVENIKDFNPIHIFECGQCFRWIRQSEGGYTGVVKGKAVNISFSEGRLEIFNATIKDFVEIWYEYFDLGRDYEKVKVSLCKDEIMREAINFGNGIRLLRQDLWETLISFIISANNRIPRIMKSVEVISKEFGEEIEFNGKSYYTFPDVNRLSGLSVEQIQVCKAGFRCKYIYDTSNSIKQGLVELNSLNHLSSGDARRELTKLSGVGDKVADCTLLFSSTKHDVFPTDVWVKRVMEELYLKREATFKEIQDFARAYFGDLAGFAQQYLFYYAREKKIGAK